MFIRLDPRNPAGLRGCHKGVFYRMQPRFYLGVTLLAMTSVVLGGCASSSSARALQKRPASTATQLSAKVAVAPAKATEDNLAEAHAHYAQGVVYDMDEDPEHALEEYSKS